jgi:polysaccharide export outer membrane protein
MNQSCNIWGPVRTTSAWVSIILGALLLVACATTPAAQLAADGDIMPDRPAGSPAAGVVPETVKNEARPAAPLPPPEPTKSGDQTRHMDVSEYVRLSDHLARAQEYAIGGGDEIQVNVFEDKNLNVVRERVTNDGRINMPLLGQLNVSDLSTSQIEALIAKQLRDKNYLLDPHVSVQILEYKSQEVLVMGAVKEPGSYLLNKAETVLGVLSKAHGVNTETAGKEIVVVRNENLDGRPEKLAIHINLRDLMSQERTTSDLPVFNNDIIYVPKAEEIFVIGEVNNPGAFFLRDRTSVVEAIGMAGGFTRIAAKKRVRISRQVQDQKQVIEIDVEKIMQEAGSIEQNILLMPNDMVIVPESFF